MIKVAVVILNWNGEGFLKQFLPVLVANTNYEGAEIIIADNASTDGSINYLKSDFPNLKTIILDKNYGFAGGYNKALEQITAEYYVLLNSDVEVTENWLQPMMHFLESNKDVVACQPKIKAFHNKNYFEHAGASGGFIDYLGFPFCRGRVLGLAEEDKGQYDEVCDVFWATGACLVIRSDMFWKVGALDETFFAHMEEIDLCWRLNARGYRIVCVPQSTVYHVGGGTLNVESPHKTYLNFRNNLLMLYKNLPQQALSKIMKWRRILDYIAAIQLYTTGKPKNAAAVIKARNDFKVMQSDFVEKRNENILYATRTNCDEMIKKSIIVEYYLKNNKKFSKIVAQIK
jgi:GT2 family glycosyltransferase